MANKPFITSIMREKRNRDAMLQWRKELDDNRGERARLRRCRDPLQVLLHSSYYRLKASLTGCQDNQALTLAAVVGLLSNADHQGSGFQEMSFAGQLGKLKTEGGAPVMSETRFRQLIKSRDWQEFYRRMRRAIRMIKGDANILSIADFVFQYGYEQRGEFNPEPSNGFQFRFAQDYYEAGTTKGKKEAS